MLDMLDLKVGDIVEYTGSATTDMKGHLGIVRDFIDNEGVHVDWFTSIPYPNNWWFMRNLTKIGHVDDAV